MASTYLTRTFSSAGNRQSWTWSGWVKKSTSYNSSDSGDREVWFGGYSASNNTDWLEFGTQGDILFATSSGISTTSTQVLRDVNGWYHALVNYNGSNLKFYINNELFKDSTDFSGNRGINVAGKHTIGAIATDQSIRRFTGLMSHVHFIDGTIYTPSAFGETDSTTGIWKPITEPSVTYGTNGFFLKFENSGAFGTDSSGNANNFTVNGTMTQTIDTPSNVFATINPLYNVTTYNGSKLSNGNLTAASSTNYKGTILSTLGASQGKWYWEVKSDSGGQNGIGISNDEITLNSWSPSSGNYVIWSGDNGSIYRPSGQTASGSTFTAGDIIGVAWNADDAEVTFYKNGTAINSGTAYSIEGTQGTMFASLSDVNTADNPTASFNFGNGYFGTTAVSSAGTNAGIGIFEYDVPSGYKALCTKNINAEEYS